MSDDDTSVSTGEPQMLHAEYKDGRLQIVEVSSFERDKVQEESILPDVMTSQDEDQHKYMQVLDVESGPSNKGLVQLDLLNLTLVRCEDGEESYRLVTNSEDGEIPSDATVTCVLQSSDGDEDCSPDSDKQEYVMVDSMTGLVYLRPSSPPPPPAPPRPPERNLNNLNLKRKKNLTPAQILEKNKALQKAKAIIASSGFVRQGKRGRRKAEDVPSPQQLISSPNFKLYLYSCKMCSFKCNAVKELQAHRTRSHSAGAGAGGGGAARSPARGLAAALQCAKCPYRAASNMQLKRHEQLKHSPKVEIATTDSITFTNKVCLDSKEVEEADVLVCGACGYESGDRGAFREHIEREHGASTV